MHNGDTHQTERAQDVTEHALRATDRAAQQVEVTDKIKPLSAKSLQEAAAEAQQHQARIKEAARAERQTEIMNAAEAAQRFVAETQTKPT